TLAPGVTPSASNRSARPPADARTETTTPRAPSGNSASVFTRLELNAKVMEDIVQSCSGEDRDRRDDADNRQARAQATLAHHHQEIRDARHEQRHHGQREDC